MLENRVTPATLTVTSAADPISLTAGTLRSAIWQANVEAGLGVSDTIVFASSLKGSTITLTQGPLVLTNPVILPLQFRPSPGTTTINGSQITVSGGGKSEGFMVDSGVHAVLAGLTIKNGSAVNGGGITNLGTLTLNNCILTGNSASGKGGGIYNSGALTLNTCTLTGNSAMTSGGGIYNYFYGSVTGNYSTLSGNSAVGIGADGGGIENDGYSTGDYYQRVGGPVTLSNCTISGNSANWLGGGIQNSGTMTVSNCTLSSNRAISLWSKGGAIDNCGTLTMTSSKLTGNSASWFGGGIANVGILTVSTSTLSSNSCIGSGIACAGGGIINGGDGTLTVSYCTISGNSIPMDTPDCSGGGIATNSTAKVSHSTISGNSARFGGGIFQTTGTLVVSNCTLAGNTARLDGGGIGIQGSTLLTVTTTVSHSTISANTASRSGGGIANFGGTLSLYNSILARNNTSLNGCPDIFGDVSADSDYNLIGDTLGTKFPTNHNRIGTFTNPINPMLSPLGNYGGPTQTMPPLAGSPALGQGGPVTTLAGSIGGSPSWVPFGVPFVATITVVNGASAFLPGDFIRIDGEQMLVTNVNPSTNTLTVYRGLNGNMATAHNASAAVYLVVNQGNMPRSNMPNIGAV